MRVLGHCTGDHKIYSTSKRLPEIQENWPRRNQVYFILLFRIRTVVVISYLHAKKITRWKIWFQTAGSLLADKQSEPPIGSFFQARKRKAVALDL